MMSSLKRWALLASMGVLLALQGCATVKSADARDPWEPMNRSVFEFNQVVDKVAIKPVAQAYVQVVPGLVRTGVGNFLGNMSDVWTFANSAMQLKGQAAAESLMRVTVNTVFGLGGVLDVATEMRLEKRKEDFGQTLGHWGVKPGMKVAVMGLGGLGHMGVKFAVAMGAEVTVLSHSPNKQADAIAMGAHHFVSTKDANNLTPLAKSFDLILNTVSAELLINDYLNLLKLDGTLVVIGLPGKPYEVHAGTLLNGRRSISGSMIGGIPEMQEMLDFCAKHSIVSDVEVIKADYINEAYKRTVASDVKYRFVIDASTF
jgi:ABC-type transporter lipoprotein component MlaA